MIRTLPVRTGYAPVSHLILHLTEDCNLRCHYCFVRKTPRTMTWETAQRSVDFLIDRNISGTIAAPEITFFGGEPFLAVDLMRAIVEYARRPRPNTYKRLTFAATTNATIATAEVERVVRESRMKLLISLDGDARASEARPFTGGRPSYPSVARNLARLVGWASWSSVRMTFHPDSLDLVGNVRHALELGAPSVLLAPVVEADWSGCETPLDTAYRALGEWFLGECRAHRWPPLEVTWGLLRRWHAARSGASRPARPCQVGDQLLSVSPDGAVMPCHRFLYHPQDWLGSVEVAQLAPGRQRFLDLHSGKMPECGGCAAEAVCGGGCRLVALEGGHGLQGAHPSHCLLMRAHVGMVARVYATLAAENDPCFWRTLRRPHRSWLGQQPCSA